ncbi:WW domain binding protein 11-domain-containing protein [Dendryphion nanum]|uniref:WW domain binding protein 11-domain-containing protein n=1 Tax=Dendryphion nanum TaxID=256645 RepID=A0A9P9IJA0_9PLEO|nr:WW domain binding protein 11-domain-containing protein [Dendryphion nanum]
MPKEKNFNPVQAAKKAEKQKQLKKQKATVQAQRNEKLARRNPARIQRDIDSLKELQEGGELRPHERQRLSELEKDLAAVNKARTALGDSAPQFREWRDGGGERSDRGDRGGRGGRGDRGGRGGVLGKRTRDGDWKGRDNEEPDSSDTDADVKDIPMPRDTPPPIPRRRNRGGHAESEPPEPKKATIVYEAAPQVRDLRKEAARFVPAAVQQKLKQAKGEKGLLDEEEFDRLESEGYMNTGKKMEEKTPESTDPELEAFLAAAEEHDVTGGVAQKIANAAEQEAHYKMMTAEAEGEIHDLASERRVAEKKLRQVEIEEVEDEDF